MATAQAQAIINNSGLTNDEKGKLFGICITNPGIYQQIVDVQAAAGANLDTALRAVIALRRTAQPSSTCHSPTTLEDTRPSFFMELIQSMSGYSVVREKTE